MPVPSFGDPNAKLLIVGLAPGAHGANRTGRMFTGDSSGKLLFQVLFKAGFASAPESSHRDDGLKLIDAWLTAAAHCAPPDNKPLRNELENCRDYLRQEIAELSKIRVVVTLGRIAFDQYLAAFGLTAARSGFLFGHNRLHRPPQPAPPILTSYHPSQQNTSTGKLTEAMLEDVFFAARSIIDYPVATGSCPQIS